MDSRGPFLALCLVGALALSGCESRSSDGNTSVTTSGEERSSTVPSTTTVTEATTSTAEAVTSTTGSPETSTTATLLGGNWAEMPLVISSYGALGWWDGQEWVQAEEDTALPVTSGNDFQVARFGWEGEVVTATGTDVRCDFSIGAPGVTVDKPDAIGGLPGLDGVAVSAGWDLFPHDIREVLDDGTYSGFARPLLSERGLELDEPVIKQLIRFDLEGDGVLEVLTVAEPPDLTLEAVPEHYSIVFLRRIVDGVVETTVLEESVYGEDGSERIPLTFNVAAIADLNGDSKMEIVLNWGYYEGSGVEVFEYVSDDVGPVYQIGQGCGV